MKKTMEVTVYSVLQICDQSFGTTPEGYLHLKGIISRSGDQEYFKAELGLVDSGNTEKIILNRPKEEVVDPMSIASFLMKPVTDNHPSSGHVNIKNFKNLMKGMISDVNATEEGQLIADIVVTDSALIEHIKNGKRELSAGYSSSLEFSDDGNSAIQRKIRGNHVAFVDKARCGRECRIFDSAKPIVKPEKERVNMAKMKIKGVEIEIADGAVAMVQTLVQDNEELVKKNKLISDSESAVQAKLDAANEKVTELEKATISDEEMVAKAEEMAAVWESAKIIDKNFACKGKTTQEIQKALVVAKIGDTMKDKNEAYLSARFDVLVDGAKAKAKDPLTASLLDAGDPEKKEEGEVSMKDLEHKTEEAKKRKMDRSKKVGDKGHGTDK